MKPTKVQLKAIKDCNPDFDTTFYYGVKSTKIFCKPSCRSIMPKEENITVNSSYESFLNEGYRPCKRCKPTNKKLPDVEWIESVKEFISTNYTEPLTLEKIADETHSSPFHLHRKFHQVENQTIHSYLIEVRINKAIEYLILTDYKISEIASKVGFLNVSSFIRVFKNSINKTPNQYRKDYRNENS